MKGTKIEFLRTLKGYNQDYVAIKANIEISRYKRIETDLSKASKEELQNIADILGTTTDDLKNPNPYLIQIVNSRQRFGNGTYNNHLSEELLKTLQKKDEQITSLIHMNENKDQLINDLIKRLNVA